MVLFFSWGGGGGGGGGWVFSVSPCACFGEKSFGFKNCLEWGQMVALNLHISSYTNVALSITSFCTVDKTIISICESSHI